jgi:hypothetical protein
MACTDMNRICTKEKMYYQKSPVQKNRIQVALMLVTATGDAGDLTTTHSTTSAREFSFQLHRSLCPVH